MTFDQLINHIAEQGPLEEVTSDPKLKKKVHNTVFDILKTMFLWYGLPWTALTDENMFDKAKLLNKVDRKTIRFCRYVQDDADDAESSAEKQQHTNKL